MAPPGWRPNTWTFAPSVSDLGAFRCLRPNMDSISPITRGFRLLFLRPAIPLAEVAWRWTFAVAFWFLTAMLLVNYTGSLPVDAVSGLLLGTGRPDLVGRAL